VRSIVSWLLIQLHSQLDRQSWCRPKPIYHTIPECQMLYSKVPLAVCLHLSTSELRDANRLSLNLSWGPRQIESRSGRRLDADTLGLPPSCDVKLGRLASCWLFMMTELESLVKMKIKLVYAW